MKYSLFLLVLSLSVVPLANANTVSSDSFDGFYTGIGVIWFVVSGMYAIRAMIEADADGVAKAPVVLKAVVKSSAIVLFIALAGFLVLGGILSGI